MDAFDFTVFLLNIKGLPHGPWRKRRHNRDISADVCNCRRVVFRQMRTNKRLAIAILASMLLGLPAVQAIGAEWQLVTPEKTRATTQPHMLRCCPRAGGARGWKQRRGQCSADSRLNADCHHALS